MKSSILKYFAILSISTGFVLPYAQPVKADQVIASASDGCSYSVTRKSWWGAYTYLNGCAITEAVNELELASTILGFSDLGAAAAGFYVAGPYGAVFAGGAVKASSVIINANKGGLSYCKEKTGHAYLRYYLGRGNFLGAYVSCN